MKNKNYLLGFILITFGSIWLLNNFNVIDFQLRYLIRGIGDLWPLILVVLGFNLLIKNQTIEKISWIAFLLLLIGYSVFLNYGYSPGKLTPGNIIKEDQKNYSIEFSQGITKGEIDLDIGGMEFDVTSTDAPEFANLSSTITGLRHETNVSGTTQKLKVYNRGETLAFNESSSYNLDLSINQSIPWYIDLDGGAIDGYLDLKEVNVEKLDVDMGAGKIEIDLGLKSNLSEILIDSGVSQVVINIPANSGVRIDFEGALNSTNLGDLNLNKEGNSVYVSENYHDSPSKYSIDVDMGLGEFSVYYY